MLPYTLYPLRADEGDSCRIRLGRMAIGRECCLWGCSPPIPGLFPDSQAVMGELNRVQAPQMTREDQDTRFSFQ